MSEHLVMALSAILVLGVGAQWLSWRLKVPAILLLLIFGGLAGPGTEWVLGHKLLDPDAILGPLLLPVVSLSVALILFEGGLTLNVRELASVGRTVTRLVTVGALLRWAVAALAARWVLGMGWPTATLLGSILMVTGPTVIGPLLRHVRPVGPVASVLKWEGIVIDPIGALAAVLVFEAIHAMAAGGQGILHAAGSVVAAGIFWTVIAGGITAVAGAAVLVVAMRRFLMPDWLQNPIVLAVVVTAYCSSEWVRPEAGLFAVTAMGVILANQRWAPVRHIMEFKESLSVLLISSLFILLASRLQLSQLTAGGWRMVLFIAVLMVVARPAGVILSTLGSGLTWQERSFLMVMAPRGIVAAAVSSVFAIRLREANVPGAEQLVPVTFGVIIATVAIYGGLATMIARRLGLATPTSEGFLIAGANPVARAIGTALMREGFAVVLVDTNRQEVQTARLAGLTATQASIVSDYLLDRAELVGAGRLLAITSNDEVNSLAAVHFARVFGRSCVYQLGATEGPSHRSNVSPELRGRMLFGAGVTFETLSERMAAGAVMRRTALTAEYGYADFIASQETEPIVMFTVGAEGDVEVITEAHPVEQEPGKTVISLGMPRKDARAMADATALPA